MRSDLEQSSLAESAALDWQRILPYTKICRHYAICIRDRLYAIPHTLSLELQALI